ncbi:uncharacterized protein N0V89_011672 [Didymosphaeria variabile]|uniref:Uncharacterized protein n=1 Tax=Didymosphaeria variabile TaxID=1932322 RepID=A0A9W8XAE3_9PLEO|nr:uncharacterized protein N0V89_011672 [Didymosphaeria variabile]KAJ4345539.1 hypothetical protein N0V89_011672 [Didymosphaeria variabile]
MPLPSRPAGAIVPADLLWRHELKEHNAALLRRLNAFEAKFTDQERRVRKAEEAATTCTGLTGVLDVVKNGVDQLETKQQEFMTGMHKRLVDIDKDIGEFRNTQERVQRLMSSYQGLDDSIVDLSSLGPRVEIAEREILGLKNSVGRKHVHEMEHLDARLEALELQRSREAAQIRAMQDDFTKRCNGEVQKLRTDVVKMMEVRRPVEVQSPYMQIPRSPDTYTRSTNLAAPANKPANGAATTVTARAVALYQTPHNHSPKMQHVPHEVETQGTTQDSTQTREIEDLDLDTAFIPDISPSKPHMPPSHASPRKKPKLHHLEALPKLTPSAQPKAQPAAQPTAQSKARLKAQPKAQPNIQPTGVQTKAEATAKSKPGHKLQHLNSSPAPEPAPSKIVKLSVSTSKKRQGSPISAPRPTKQGPVVSATRQINAGLKIIPQSREKQQRPSQPARRSRRRSANATFYELGWDQTQQPQKKVGPVYDNPNKPSKPVKTKPRRLPPVPDE